MLPSSSHWPRTGANKGSISVWVSSVQVPGWGPSKGRGLCREAGVTDGHLLNILRGGDSSLEQRPGMASVPLFSTACPRAVVPPSSAPWCPRDLPTAPFHSRAPSNLWDVVVALPAAGCPKCPPAQPRDDLGSLHPPLGLPGESRASSRQQWGATRLTRVGEMVPPGLREPTVRVWGYGSAGILMLRDRARPRRCEGPGVPGTSGGQRNGLVGVQKHSLSAPSGPRPSKAPSLFRGKIRLCSRCSDL